MVFIKVCPVLKSLPQIGTPLSSASLVKAGISTDQIRRAVGKRNADLSAA
jgi:hypothetical protein